MRKMVKLQVYTWYLCLTPILPEASFGLQVLSLPVCVCVCVCARVCVNHELVRTITHHPLVKIFIVMEVIDFDLQGQI